MASLGILQRLDRLSKSSPQFPDRLTSILYEKGYKDCILNLQDGDAAWLVEYLDNVCLHTTFHPPSV